MGELATLTHEGSEITLSMIRWGALRRAALSWMMPLDNCSGAPCRFIPQYEIAIYDGSSKVVFSQRPKFIFHYPDKEAALRKWDELQVIIKRGGLDSLKEFNRDGHPKQGRLAELTSGQVQLSINQYSVHKLEDHPMANSGMGPQPASDWITPEDEENYGAELIDLAKRAAKEAMGPELDALRQALQSQAPSSVATSHVRDTPPLQRTTGWITSEDEEGYGAELIDLVKRAAREAMGPELNKLRLAIASTGETTFGQISTLIATNSDVSVRYRRAVECLTTVFANEKRVASILGRWAIAMDIKSAERAASDFCVACARAVVVVGDDVAAQAARVSAGRAALRYLAAFENDLRG